LTPSGKDDFLQVSNPKSELRVNYPHAAACGVFSQFHMEQIAVQYQYN
jgi:hypothetical protein